MSASFPRMQPRDVVTPSATLLGLILTALGILVVLAGESETVTVRNFALVSMIVVAFFVCAVIFTALSSLLNKGELWKGALILYVVGWGSLGTVVILTLLGYSYGIKILQFQFPQFEVGLVSALASIVGLVLGLASYLLIRRTLSEYKKRVSELIEKMEVSSQELREFTSDLESRSINLRDSLRVLRDDIEGELRKLTKIVGIRVTRPYPIRKMVTALKRKKIINPTLAYSILFVYNACSRAGVHEEFLPEKEARMILDLGGRILISLRSIMQKYQTG